APPIILFFAKNCWATYPPAKIVTSLSIHLRIRGESSYSIRTGARRDNLHSPRLPSALLGLIVTCLNDTSCKKEHTACPASWYAVTSACFISSPFFRGFLRRLLRGGSRRRCDASSTACG